MTEAEKSVLDFVRGERGSVARSEVCCDLVMLHRANPGMWPDQNADQWLTTIETLIKRGELISTGDKVSLPVKAEVKKPVQQSLF